MERLVWLVILLPLVGAPWTLLLGWNDVRAALDGAADFTGHAAADGADTQQLPGRRSDFRRQQRLLEWRIGRLGCAAESGAGRCRHLAVRVVVAPACYGSAGQLGVHHGSARTVLLVIVDARHGAAGSLRRAGHHLVLHLFRVHAGAAVFPHRHLGQRGSAAGCHEVLHLHTGRQCADVLGPVGAGILARASKRKHDVFHSAALGRFHRSGRADASASPDLGLLGTLRRVRHQSAAVSTAHLASPGPCPGTHRRQRDPGGAAV